MSKVYAMRNAGTNNGSSRQNNNGGTKKKDRFQEAYEQGTRIYEQNRSQLVQQTQQLQTQLQGIGNGPLTYQQARDVRTYYNNLQSLTTYGFDTSEQIQAIGGFARQNNQLLSTYKTEKDYNNGYLYPARYQGLSGSTNTTNQLNGLRRTIGALRQRGGDKARADALQAEYDWLEQHQYDYWSQDELKQGIASAENAVQAASSDLKHYSDYSYRTKNWDWQTKSNDAEKRRAGAQQTLDAMRTAKETNAYRDVLTKMSGADLDNLQKLATLSDTQARIRSSAVLPTAAQNGWAAQNLQIQAAQYSDEIEQLKDSLRGKGYTEAQILSLTDYVIRQQHQEQRMSEMQQLADWTKQNFWTKAAGSAVSVPINLMGGVGYLDLAAQNAFAGTDAITGDRKRIDQYSDLKLSAKHPNLIGLK